MSSDTFRRYTAPKGWKFTPLRIGDNKVPIDKNWNNPEAPLEYEPNQLYGMMPPPSMVVVDVDVKNGKRGLDSWQLFLNDHYTQAQIDAHFTKPSVLTPSGGMHFYLFIKGNKGKTIKKIQPRYTDIDFIVSGRAMAVAGDQTLAAGKYILTNTNNFPSLDLTTSPLQYEEDATSAPQPLTQAPSLDNDAILSLLKFIDPDPYENWYKVGLALSRSDLPDPKAAFHSWSQGSAKYSPQDCEKKWSNLATAPTPPQFITTATIPYLARLSSPDKADEINAISPTTDYDRMIMDFRERFVRIQTISSTMKFFDTTLNAYCDLQEVEIALNPIAPEIGKRLGKKKPATIKDCLNCHLITNAHDATFNPAVPSKFYIKDGIKYLNSYSPDLLPPRTQGTSPDLDFLLTHLRLMVGEDYFYDLICFLAALVQHPEKKVKYMLILQGNHSIGKSFLLTMLQTHVFGCYARRVSKKDLSESYNGWAFNTRLVMIDEFKISDNKETIALLEDLKTLITEDQQRRREKYLVGADLPLHCSFLALTNHKDCLPLCADNRRFHVIFCPLSSLDEAATHHGMTREEYSDRLTSFCDPDHPVGAQFHHYLYTHTTFMNLFNWNFRPAISDFDKARAVTLRRHPFYGNYIRLIRTVYNTPQDSPLPDYLNPSLLVMESRTATHRGTDVLIFDYPLKLSTVESVCEDLGYQEHEGIFYHRRLNPTQAQHHIATTMLSPSPTPTTQEPVEIEFPFEG